ncbi:MAG: dephospho-CoA kinase [Cytophagales bacterium]|nr:dephospho-CoA kinase [Cytophagales bacterium]
MNRPLLVGITGGIGAGKSIVTKIFKTFGVLVYDADSRAKWLMANSESLTHSVQKLFGEESYSDEKLNRTHIAALAFHTPKLLDQLNALVHPEVERDLNEWVSKNSEQPYLVKEAALIFETGSYTKLDRIILVTAPKDVRIERVLSRDTHRSKEDTLAIMDKQLTDEEKRAKADIELINDGSTLLIPQILKLHEQFSIR